MGHCGMISQYNATSPHDGPRNIMFAVGKGIRLESFAVSNHFANCLNSSGICPCRFAKGMVTWKETVEYGFEKAPMALIRLFKGEL